MSEEAARGVLGANGEPAMPMRVVLPPDLVKIADRQWTAGWRLQQDGSLVLEMGPPPPPQNAPAPLIIQ